MAVTVFKKFVRFGLHVLSTALEHIEIYSSYHMHEHTIGK